MAWDQDDWDEGIAHCLTMIKPWLAGATRVLDYGAGPGRLAVPVAELGYEVVAMDTSPEMLSFGLQHPRVAYVEVGQKAPICDAAYSVLTFQHLPDEAIVLAQQNISKQLSRGSLVVIQLTQGSAQGPTAWERNPYEIWSLISSRFVVEQRLRDPSYPSWWWVVARS